MNNQHWIHGVVIATLVTVLAAFGEACSQQSSPRSPANDNEPLQMPWSERMAIPLTALPWPMQLSNPLVIHATLAVRSTALTCAQRSREIEEEIESKSNTANRLQLATAILAGLTTGAVGGGQFIKDDATKANYTAAAGIGGGVVTTVLAALAVYNNANDQLQQDSKMLSAIGSAIRTLYTTWNALLAKYSCEPPEAGSERSTAPANVNPSDYDHKGDTQGVDPGPVLHLDTPDIGVEWSIRGPTWTVMKRERLAEYLKGNRCQLGTKGQEALHLALILEIDKLSDACNGAPSKTDPYGAGKTDRK